MNKQKRMKLTAICIDMLDRVEGSIIYNIQKKLYGYTDDEYQEAIQFLKDIYQKIKNEK